MKIFYILVVAAVVLLMPTLARLVPEHRKLQEVPPGATVIPNEFIVIFGDTVAPTDVDATANAVVDDLPDGTLVGTYSTLLQGFAVSDVADPTMLLENEAVVSVIPNLVTTINAQQRNPPWGLDRIDEMDLPLDMMYNYNCDGAEVFVYVLDTGIRLTHQEFGGRARCGAFFLETSCDDGQGHGTHVAGIVGGTTYGVAKGVTLIAVKVIDSTGFGTLDALLGGMNYLALERATNPTRKMVANFSFGFRGVVMPTVDEYVATLVGLDIAVVAAAGNDNVDACSSSPGRAVSAVTVGATNMADSRSTFSVGASNFGACVDLFAPGSDIVSAGIGSDTATNTISGTSQASPHVAGVVSMYLQAGLSVQNMLNDAVTGKVVNPGNLSPNKLVNIQSVCTGPPVPPVPMPPVPMPPVPVPPVPMPPVPVPPVPMPPVPMPPVPMPPVPMPPVPMPPVPVPPIPVTPRRCRQSGIFCARNRQCCSGRCGRGRRRRCQ